MIEMLERRYFTAELRAADGDSPTLDGYAAVFDALSENLGGFRERIAPGAFARAVKEDDVRALWNHNPDKVLGRSTSGTLEMEEDQTGLRVQISPPDTQWARDLLVSIRRGDVDQMSFGFQVRPGGERWEEEDGHVVRTLTDVALFDVSPVTYPAYPQTQIAARSIDWARENGLLRGPELPAGEQEEQGQSRPTDLLRRRLELKTKEHLR